MIGQSCPECGRVIPRGDSFCASCGTAVSTAAVEASSTRHATATVTRRRLSGAEVLVPIAPTTNGANGNGHHDLNGDATPAANGSLPGEIVLPGAGPRAGVAPRRRRRRRQRWYRRPLLVIPAAFLIIVAVAGGVVAQRLGSTLSTVQSVSTPPPEVVVVPEQEDIAAIGGDPAAAAPVQVDTAPAVAAVAAAGRVKDSGGGLFDEVRDTASSVADLGHGAAVAAGVGGNSGPALTILVMGVDAQPGEAIDIGVRPDVLMVVRLDPVAGTCRLLSVPRDTRVELPGYGDTKINHALMVGGIPYQMMVVEDLLNITFDRYLLIDFTGFQELVDAVGGIQVTVPEAVTFGQIHISAGLQTFDGEEALAYARYRDTASQGDAGRITREWSILSGLGDAASGQDIAGEVNDLLPAVEDHLRTDLSATDFVEIAKAYGDRCTSETVQPTMLDGFRVLLPDDPIFHMSLYYNVVDEAKIEERVAELMGTEPDLSS